MEQEEQRFESLADIAVFDADVHIPVPPQEIAEYVDQPYKDYLSNSANQKYVPIPSSSWDPHLGGSIETDEVESPEDVNAFCRNQGIDYALISNQPPLHKITQTELAVQLMSAYNNHLLERCLDGYDQFVGLAAIAPQRPDKAAEEIDRIADEDQIVGIRLGTTGQTPPLGDARYDPIYEAAEDNDLHVAYQGDSDAFMFEFPSQDQAFETFFEVHSLAHPMSQTMTLTSLIVQGVPEKFPDLNFSSLEAGISWVPYMMWRLNKEYSIRRSEAPLLEKSPEEYIRDQFYFASHPLGEYNTPEYMTNIITALGPERILFSSGYPQWDSEIPGILDGYLQDVCSPKERKRVFFDNAIEAFGMNL